MNITLFSSPSVRNFSVKCKNNSTTNKMSLCNLQSLSHDTVCFKGNGVKSDFSTGLALHDLSKNSPNTASMVLKSLPKKEFLTFVLGTEDKYPGYALSVADENQLKIYFESAMEKGCAEDMLNFKVGWKLRSGNTISGDLNDDYLICRNIDDKRKEYIYNLCDDELKEKMLNHADIASVLPMECWHNAPNANFILTSKDNRGCHLYELNPYRCRTFIDEGVKIANSELSSLNPEKNTQGKVRLEQMYKIAKTIICDNPRAFKALTLDDIATKALIAAIPKNKAKEIANKINMNGSPSALFYQLLAGKIDDGAEKAKFLNKNTAGYMTVRESIWRDNEQKMKDSLLKVPNSYGSNSLICKQSFEKTMDMLSATYDEEHISDLRLFLLYQNPEVNAKSKTRYDSWGDPIGETYYGTKYPMEKVFEEKIDNNEQRQYQFENLLRKVIVNKSTSNQDAKALLQKYKNCVSSDFHQRTLNIKRIYT